ncbi:uncharacterized protein [Apostichopus japonicus]|uniref:uncharacterized protein n=1 Tax=Stichopus japonicus TaxID=307972 RepID=UPI003AB118C8
MQLQRDFEDLKEKTSSQSSVLEEVLAERELLQERVKQLERDVAIERRIAKDSQTRRTQLDKGSSNNIARREQRKTEKIVRLKQQLKGKDVELKQQSKKHTSTIVEKSYQLQRAKKQVRYYKKKAAASTSQQKFEDVSERLNYREEQMEQLQERLDDILDKECGKVSTIVKGKYRDSIRSVYQHLMCLNVGSNNCEDIVRTVLKGIVGLDVERLPKATFAKEMVFEARAMAQLQFCDAVLEDDNLTLHSDGSTKFGHHYGSYDVSFGEGKVFTLGVRETADGTAVTTLLEEYWKRLYKI